MAKLSLVFILYISLIFSSTVYANANFLEPHRRSHGSLNRILKKRAPQGLGNILADTPAGAGQTPSPTQSAVQTTGGSDTAASGSTPTSSAAAVVATVSSAASPSPSSGVVGSLVSGVLQTLTSGSTSTSTTSATSSSTTHTSSVQTTQAAAASTPTSQQQQGQQDKTTSILFVTASASSTPTETAAPESASTLSHTAVTVLIIIAVSIGAATIVWTIIRKWKFRPSSSFEDRMQPIDWQPDAMDDGGIPGSSRRPLSNASSFHSGSHASEDHNHSQNGAHSTASLGPLPDHDFTPGPAHFAPVGGYADLARGSSPAPEPVMQEALSHAPSINQHYQYDQYGVPLHHGYNAPSY
ncbi:hypothetical protein ID866_1156 [Astraeus odoratus]|nr:hypothetical protein ID866_1156 [Astraeus odoratus]